MAVVVPAVPSDTPFWTQRTSLAGVEYVLSFAWNGRLGLWSLGLADVHGVDIATGLALVTNWPLLTRAGNRDARRPPGDLVVIDTLGQFTDPTYVSLGAQHLLLYTDPGEIPAGFGRAP